MLAKLSLVVTARDAGSEFDEFLSSLTQQEPGPYSVEVLVVAIGADAVAARLKRSIARAGVSASVLAPSTPSVSSARREGLARAGGDWVSFPQASDALEAGYLRTCAEAIAHDGGRSVIYLASRAALGGKRRRGAGHPLATSLEADPSAVPSEVVRGFFRPATVGAAGIALDDATDPLLVSELLSGTPAGGSVTRVPAALYLARPLRGSSSATEWFRSSAGNYIGLVDPHAHLLARFGDVSAPRWQQELAMRDIRKLIAYEYATPRRATVLGGAAGELFRTRLGALLRLIDTDLIVTTSRPGALDERADILMALRSSSLASEGRAHVVAADERSGLMEVRYSTMDDGGRESFRLDGAPVVPGHAKIRSLPAFGQERVAQRIAWVPASAALELEVDGRPLAISLRSGAALPTTAAGMARAIAENIPAADVVEAAPPRAPLGDRARAAVRTARRSWLSKAALVRMSSRLPWVRRRYRDAWTFMDRADGGQDNAEHLYRWVARSHPATNAWFVIRADVPDYGRLSAEGFRIVAYGTVAHQQLLYNTRHYLSSHVGVDVSRPIFDRYLQREAPWTFTFLQHGVIHNDLSIWLNNQQVHHFVTTTHGEFAGIAGDRTPYRFTDREVVLTGMPRLDRLRAIADDHPVAQRRTIVVAPTWRSGLFEPAPKPGMPRTPKPDFAQSPFIRSIIELLAHPTLARLASAGYDIRFVPHPNLAADFPYGELPGYVSVSTYASTDVQQLLGSAAVFVTDYSSVAFDAAFADADIVYLHADAGGVFGVDHTLSPGYFDFERDGFGPIGRTVDEAMTAVAAAVDGRGPTVYRERARQAFAFWDAGSCARVYDMVVAADS